MRASCNQHGRERERAVFFEMCVDCKNAVYATRAKKFRIGRDQIFSVAVMNGEIKKTLPHQEISDTTENLRVIALAEFRQENSDRLHALALQRSGDHAGLVIELFRGGLDALTGRIWNGTTWRII